MEQQPEANERSGRPPLARLPHPTRSFSRSRSRSPSGRDDEDGDDGANGHALSRPAGEGRDSGDEPSPVCETAPTTRAEEPMALSRPRWNAPPMERGLRRPPPPRDGDHYRPSPPRDDVLDDIRPTIDHTIDHINALRVHYRNKAATSGLDSKAITVETLAAEAWMNAYLEIQKRNAQQLVNGFAADEVKLAKYRNALTAAKRALTEINETSDDASVRAASALAEITKALEGEER